VIKKKEEKRMNQDANQSNLAGNRSKLIKTKIGTKTMIAMKFKDMRSYYNWQLVQSPIYVACLSAGGASVDPIHRPRQVFWEKSGTE
jgi:hypothetical protein